MTHQALSVNIELVAGPPNLIKQINPAEYDDKPQDECGVFGIWGPDLPVGQLTYDALYGLQHRGQSGAGIAIQDEATRQPLIRSGVDLLHAAIPEAVPRADGQSVIDLISPTAAVAIGHTRYSTANSNEAAQPFLGSGSKIALAHNGHIQDIAEVAADFGIDAAEAPSDSWVITELLDKRTVELGSLAKALADVLPMLEGAYCLTIMDGRRLVGVRDPWGVHPLSLGKIEGGGYVLSSESVVFASVGAEMVRDIEPGEIISIDETGITSTFIEKTVPVQNCMFEYVYIARPDGTINGVTVYEARLNMGRHLAEDHPVEADIVVGVPDSGMDAAQGYADVSGLPLRARAIIKNPYAGRTFLERGAKRAKALDDKHRPNPTELAGKRVVLVDDSMVKGNTMIKLVQKIRDAGATEVHVRSAAPYFRFACYAGLDTRETWRLIARDNRPDEEIATEIDADSVGFNTVERVAEAINNARVDAAQPLAQLCVSCATGEYPFKGPTFVGLPKTRAAQVGSAALPSLITV